MARRGIHESETGELFLVLHIYDGVVTYWSLRNGTYHQLPESEFDHHMPDPDCKVHWYKDEAAKCSCLYKFRFLREG